MKNFQFTSLSSRRRSKFSADNVANLDVDAAMTKLLKQLFSVLGDVTSACIKLLSVGMTSLLHVEIFKNNTTFFNFPDMFRRYIRHRQCNGKITSVWLHNIAITSIPT